MKQNAICFFKLMTHKLCGLLLLL